MDAPSAPCPLGGASRRSPQMLAEKLQRARPGERGARGVVALALVAVEAVAGEVEADRDIRILGGELAHARDRNVLVFLAEVEHRWNARLLVFEPEDPAAVVADRGAQALELRGRQPGDRSAEAIADGADPAAFAGDFDRGGHIAQDLLAIELVDDRDAPRPRVGVVADVEPRLDALEDRGRNGEIIVDGEAVGHRADMGVDAENLLDDDDGAARSPLRVGAPGADLGFSSIQWPMSLSRFERSNPRGPRPFAQSRCRR